MCEARLLQGSQAATCCTCEGVALPHGVVCRARPCAQHAVVAHTIVATNSDCHATGGGFAAGFAASHALAVQFAEQISGLSPQTNSYSTASLVRPQMHEPAGREGDLLSIPEPSRAASQTYRAWIFTVQLFQAWRRYFFQEVPADTDVSSSPRTVTPRLPEYAQSNKPGLLSLSSIANYKY